MGATDEVDEETGLTAVQKELAADEGGHYYEFFREQLAPVLMERFGRRRPNGLPSEVDEGLRASAIHSCVMAILMEIALGAGIELEDFIQVTEQIIAEMREAFEEQRKAHAS